MFFDPVGSVKHKEHAGFSDRKSDAMLNTESKPLVSVIIPSYNQGKFIRYTIDSCLKQEYRPLEIIVIDGASQDSTVEILHEYDSVPEVRWMTEADDGVVDAVNKGLALAKGEIAGIQSSDDGYLLGAISEAVKVFTENPDLGLVYGDWIYVDADGHEKRRFQTGQFSLIDFLCCNTLIMQPVTFFRLKLAQDLGGWNRDYFVADIEMWLRMVFRTQVKKIDSFWGIRRLHDEQRNTQAATIVKSFFNMIDASPDIARLPRSLKRAAQAGKYVMRAGYNPSGKHFQKYLDYWKAVLYYPPVFAGQKLGGIFIPGYWTMYKGYRLFIRAARKIGRFFSGINNG